MPWRCRRVREPAGGGERRLGRVVAARRREQGVHARRVARQLHVLRERARVLAGDRRHDVARAVRGQLGAQHDRAARQVAAQAGGAPHDLVRVELVRLRAQLLQERAAQVLLDLLLGLLDRDLRERGDRREVEELGRVRRGRGGRPPGAARSRSARRPELIGTSPTTPGGTGAGRSLPRSPT